MYKIIGLLLVLSYSITSYAQVNIKLACEEKKEQQESLFTMSTSNKEANLAGQCIGYYSSDKVDLVKVCSEYVEQKKALLSMSTSLKEANLAGQCIGAIFNKAEECETFRGTYISIAEDILSTSTLNCNSF